MGSLQLDCPLCCSETFPCHNSLKYHLLSITDNLICPACGKRFERIIDLAMHLGRECLDTSPETVDFSSEESGKQAATDDGKNGILHQTNVSSPVTVVIKEESSEENEIAFDELMTDSILAKALMKTADQNASDKDAAKNDLPVNNDGQVAEDDLYYCSSCAVHFTSVEEHLQKFHEGHQIFIEEEKGDSVNEPLNTNSVCIAQEDEGDDEDEYDNESVEIIKAIKTSELLNTVQEEECVDRDGRLYTRKVVKIEKFWDDKDTESKDPVDLNQLIAIKADPSQAILIFGENILPASNDVKNNSGTLEIYQCSKCGTKFSSMDNYYKHKCSELQVDNIKCKKCKICKACFVNSKYLAAHMKIHKSKRSALESDIDPNPPFVCEICNTEFLAYKSLRLHRRMHEPIKSKDIEPPVNYGMLGEQLGDDTPREMFICQICKKPYDKEYEDAHKKFHSKELDFNCDICNRKFYTQENLDMHMRAHSDTKKFTCSYCKKGFLTNEKLEAHMLSKCQRRQYECQYCGRRFARPHEKVKHERIHTGEKPHVCEICGKAFRVSYCLTLHMRTHSGTRPYKCNHCGKRFKAHSVYNHHLLTHSEDRKYKCPYCPKTFKTGVQLAGHKNSHTKPFTCTECNRPFASLYAVRAHMETHLRQNNLKYRCWLCGASYARAFALRDHMREQHSSEQVSTIGTETIVLDDYTISETVEANAPILTDGDESMLIDVGTEVVDNIEMAEVQVSPELPDNGDT